MQNVRRHDRIQVKQYFPEDYDRWCYPTDYCRKKLGSSLWGAPKGYHTCKWWCYRGLGITFRDYYGDYVDYDGDVVTGMEDIGNELGVRPVMWIKTE